jgi:hypothetical protein
MFARGNYYWSIVSTSWGFTIGPYACIGGFLLLILSWFVRVRYRTGRWTWQIRQLKRVDLATGKAPESFPADVDEVLWKRAVHVSVEAI